MRNISVIKHLFVLAIISIILNSIFILIFVEGYISTVVFYGLSASSHYYYYYYSKEGFSIFAAIIESLSIFASVVCAILTMVGSCLAVSPNKKRRKVGLILSLVSICILSMHLVINIIVMIVSLLGYNVNSGAVLAPIVVFQSILLIYNSIFVCVIGCSLRQVADE